MKKKYNFEEDNESQKVNEPAIQYGANKGDTYPYSFSLQELKERAIQGIEEIREGKYISQEEMEKRFES